MTNTNNSLFEVIEAIMVSSPTRAERAWKVIKAVKASYGVQALPNRVVQFLIAYTLTGSTTVDQDETLLAIIGVLTRDLGQPETNWGILVLHSEVVL